MLILVFLAALGVSVAAGAWRARRQYVEGFPVGFLGREAATAAGSTMVVLLLAAVAVWTLMGIQWYTRWPVNYIHRVTKQVIKCPKKRPDLFTTYEWLRQLLTFCAAAAACGSVASGLAYRLGPMAINRREYT